MSDKYYTLMVVPERSDKIRKITVPAWYLRIAMGSVLALMLIGVFVLFDYLHVLSQVAENKKLRVENHILRLDVQEAKTRLESLDQTVVRIKTFAQKLRVLANLDQPGAQKILETPAPSNPSNQKGPAPRGYEEDSGNIDDGASGYQPLPEDGSIPNGNSSQEVAGGTVYEPTDKHALLEYQRSLSLKGELGQSFESEDLVEKIRKVSESAVQLIQVSEVEEQNLADLQESLQDRAVRLRFTPSIMPAQGWISSEFGHRSNPWSGVKTFHAGIDIANNRGTPVFAPADGVVTQAGVLGGFGQVVRIEHGFGLVTKFGHNSRIVVKPGTKVIRGQKIAEMGSTGRSTGTHLHYQVEVNSRPVNPRLFILEDIF